MYRQDVQSLKIKNKTNKQTKARSNDNGIVCIYFWLSAFLIYIFTNPDNQKLGHITGHYQYRPVLQRVWKWHNLIPDHCIQTSRSENLQCLWQTDCVAQKNKIVQNVMAASGTSRNTLTDGGHHSYQQQSMTPGSGEGKPVEETWFCAVKSASFARVFSFTNENVTLNSGCPNSVKEITWKIYKKIKTEYRHNLF